MKRSEGITLISLIITIIVMAVLVAVSIQILNNSGLITNAKLAAQKSELKALEEKILLSYEYDQFGDVDPVATKNSIREVLKDYTYSIKDTGGNLPFTITINSKNDCTFKVTAKVDGISSQIIDGNEEMLDTGIKDVMVIWEEAESEGEVVPIIIAKVGETTPNYTKDDAKDALNEFFMAQYNLYSMIQYIGDEYGFSNLTWVDSIPNTTIDEQEEIKDILEKISMVKMIEVEELLGTAVEGESGTDILDYYYSKGLVTRQNGDPIQFNNFEDFLAFLDEKKLDYSEIFEIFYKFEALANEEEQEESEDPNSEEPSVSEQIDGMFDMIEGILSGNDFYSVDALYTSLYNFDIEEYDAPIPNAIKNKILEFVNKDRLEKALCAFFAEGIEMLKPYGPYFATLGKIDSTVNSYTNQLYTDYTGPTAGEMFEAVQNEGIGIQSNYYGEVLTINGRTMTYSAEMSETLGEKAQVYINLSGLIGGLMVVDGDVSFVLNDNDNVTITFGDFSETKTKAEWDMMQ